MIGDKDTYEQVGRKNISSCIIFTDFNTVGKLVYTIYMKRAGASRELLSMTHWTPQLPMWIIINHWLVYDNP